MSQDRGPERSNLIGRGGILRLYSAPETPLNKVFWGSPYSQNRGLKRSKLYWEGGGFLGCPGPLGRGHPDNNPCRSAACGLRLRVCLHFSLWAAVQTPTRRPGEGVVVVVLGGAEPPPPPIKFKGGRRTPKIGLQNLQSFIGGGGGVLRLSQASGAGEMRGCRTTTST